MSSWGHTSKLPIVPKGMSSLAELFGGCPSHVSKRFKVCNTETIEMNNWEKVPPWCNRTEIRWSVNFPSPPMISRLWITFQLQSPQLVSSLAWNFQPHAVFSRSGDSRGTDHISWVKLLCASIAQTRKSMWSLRHDRSGSRVKNVELSDHTISADLTIESKLGLAVFLLVIPSQMSHVYVCDVKRASQRHWSWIPLGNQSNWAERSQVAETGSIMEREQKQKTKTNWSCVIRNSNPSLNFSQWKSWILTPRPMTLDDLMSQRDTKPFYNHQILSSTFHYSWMVLYSSTYVKLDESKVQVSSIYVDQG